MPHIAENPMKIGWLVPEIEAVEGFAKHSKTKEIVPFKGSQLAKSEKVHSSHVTAMKFIGRKWLV